MNICANPKNQNILQLYHKCLLPDKLDLIVEVVSADGGAGVY